MRCLMQNNVSNSHLPGTEAADLLERIEQAFKSGKSDFPRGGAIDYGAVLRGWISQVEANVLPHTTAAAVSIDGGRLTSHDVEHVRRVRALCSELVNRAKESVTPYEMVFLLCAVYLHDLGNALGREKHEQRAREVLDAANLPVTLDKVEALGDEADGRGAREGR